MAIDYDLAPLFESSIQSTYDASSLRKPYSDTLQQGVLDAASLKVVQRAAGANMSVDVGTAATPNIAYVRGSSVADQGLYRVRFSGAVKNIAVTANASGNPRLDQVVLYIIDSQHAGSPPDKAVLDVLAGTANASTTIDNRTGAATLPASALLLADILVPAGASSIVTANIRDRRPWARGAFVVRTRSSGDITITATSPSAFGITDFQFRLECTGNPLSFVVQGAVTGTNVAQFLALSMIVDGSAVDGYYGIGTTTISLANSTLPAGFVQTATPSAGSHLFNLGSYRDSGAGTVTLSANATRPLQLVVREHVGPSLDNGAS